MPQEPDKIAIQWDDLNTRKVEQRLKEQEALARNRRQAEMNPVAAALETEGRGSILYNPVFVMAAGGV